MVLLIQSGEVKLPDLAVLKYIILHRIMSSMTLLGVTLCKRFFYWKKLKVNGLNFKIQILT
jgi:hypothetical protein